ncbi:MAG: 50S ribosomal protein L17 [Saprospiraceae bacterium]
MRHGDKINNLGRTASHRRAMLANMSCSLIAHKRIVTTLAKAKALRRYLEPIITKAKNNTTHSRRIVFSQLQNKEAIKELFGPIALEVAERNGGYLRVIKLGFRRGDGAETALIEFVDYNKDYNPNEGKVRVAKKTRRGSRKSSSAAAETSQASAPVAEAVVEDATEQVEAIADEAPAASDENTAVASADENKDEQA